LRKILSATCVSGFAENLTWIFGWQKNQMAGENSPAI